MSYSSSMPDQSMPASATRQTTLITAIFLCAVLVFQIRFHLSSHVMDRLVNYTGTGGAIYEKLHFGTYGIFALLPVALLSRPFVLYGREIAVARMLVLFSLLMIALILYLGAVGRSGSIGFIIDTYVTAGAAGLLVLTLPHGMRRLIGNVTLMMLIASALVGFIEAATQHRFLPYPSIRDVFRPAGLTAHPLTLGALSASAIGFVAVTRWPVWVRLSAIMLLYIGCIISTARTAFALASIELLLLLLFSRWPKLSKQTERQAKFVILLFVLPVSVILVAVFLSAGFMERFKGPLVDDSFMARVTIYRVFEYFSWSDILMGVHIDQLMFVVNKKLKLDFIESAPVVLTMLFGLPAALVFTVALGRLLVRLLRDVPGPAQLGALVFLLAALSNNTFTVKTPVIAQLVVLLIAFRRVPAAAMTAGTGERPPAALALR